ncbi:MAG TPA: hypothetical protein VGM19_14540 [Armatimonadota bacterium]|jgi:hypothetical protein
MSDNLEQLPQERKQFPATVVKVVDHYHVVINRGAEDGVVNGQRFLIYQVSDEEILDPETGEYLGKLEIVRGSGTVSHLQAKISTVMSDRTREKTRVVTSRRRPLNGWGGLGLLIADSYEEVPVPTEVTVAFDHPEEGDKARPL